VRISENRWIYVGAALFGLRAAVMVFVAHERLVPDSYEYAHGYGWWLFSSASASTAGILGGWTAVSVYGVLGASVLGGLIGRYSPPATAGLRLCIAFLLPPSLYTMQPSADAFGAAGALYATRLRSFACIPALFCVALLHMVAALAVACEWVGRRLDLPYGVGAFAGGLVGCGMMLDFQMRYFLPALVIGAVYLPIAEGLGVVSRGVGRIPA